MKKTKFSVALGLFDYINPLLYSITTITIIKNLFDLSFFSITFLVGAIVSLIFGFAIPTVKLLVGLGKMPFKMPVNLVFYVNSGIFLSGISLLKLILNINTLLFICILLISILLLFLIFKRTKKFNTIAVLTGAIGYILVYISLLYLSYVKELIIPAILCILAILFFISLCLIGIKANLKDAKIHWIIEICNVLCQLFVAISTLLIFMK